MQVKYYLPKNPKLQVEFNSKANLQEGHPVEVRTTTFLQIFFKQKDKLAKSIRFTFN